MRRAGRGCGALLAAILCAAAPPARGADTFYEGEEGEARVYTNIPQRRGLRPLPGFGDEAEIPPRRPSSLRARAFDDLIETTARQHGVHPELVRALIQVESAFDPGAISPKGARGLMQIMPDTARLYEVHNLFDPVENVRAGVRHLAHLAGVYGDDLDRVLAAYNAGEKAVRRYDGIPDFDETREYVRRIKKLYSGPILMRGSKTAPTPAFYTYEDEGGVLHVSDRPIAPRPGAEPCVEC